MSGIAIDTGDTDFVRADDELIHETLTRFGIAHDWEIYVGDPRQPREGALCHQSSSLLHPSPERQHALSAPVLSSNVDLNSEQAQARAAHNRALAGELRERVAKAALGGDERSRERHVSRGKAPPPRASGATARSRCALSRDRPTRRERHVQRRGARCRDHCRDRPGFRAPVHGLRQRRDGEGRHLLPDDREKAPSPRRRSRAKTACPASTWSTAAVRTCRTRPTSFPTATTSAASSTTRPT